jgi:MSHA pilin protein MshC
VTQDSRRAASGFTLTELVVVIIIATALGALAIARINTQPFEAEGLANEVAAAVRYAQKIAISQRRDVAVGIAGNSVSLTYPGVGGAAVRKPPGTDPFTVSKGGVSVTGAGFTFNALGRPSASSTITVTGADSPPTVKTVTIEAETGYVRYTP